MLEKWSAFWKSVSLVIFGVSLHFASVCKALKSVYTGTESLCTLDILS